jgi:hypothetical protein
MSSSLLFNTCAIPIFTSQLSYLEEQQSSNFARYLHWYDGSVVSYVSFLSSQAINLMNIAKHKIRIMLFPFMLKDKNLF